MCLIRIVAAKRELYKIQREEEDEKKWKQLVGLAGKLNAPIPVGNITREKIVAITQNIHIVLQTEIMFKACVLAAVSAIMSFISVVLFLFLK